MPRYRSNRRGMATPDLVLFASEWLRQDCVEPDWCAGGDFDKSGEIGFLDFALFAEHWLEGR